MLLFYILTSRFSFLRSLSISYYALIVFIIFQTTYNVAERSLSRSERAFIDP